MKTFDLTNRQDLNHFLESTNPGLFNLIIERIESEEKKSYLKLFKYIYCIIEHSTGNAEELDVLNLHFEKNVQLEVKTLIAEFIWHYYFCKAELDEISQQKNTLLQNTIDELTAEVDEPLIMPGKGAVAQRKIREIRKKARGNLKFYKRINPNSSLTPETLINLKTKQQDEISGAFKYIPAYKAADELDALNSFVIHSTQGFNDIKQLRLNTTHLLKIIKNIVLFDCENRVQRFSPYNYQQLANLNENHGTAFRSFVIVTFSNSNNLNSVTSKINRLKERYYIPNQTSYIVTSKEADYLLRKEQLEKKEILFLEPSYSVFWEDFHLETKINELYELRSIKMMNVYSLCFNQEIKDFILTNIFSEDSNHRLITDDTAQEIHDLPIEDAQRLKDLLSNVLDLVIGSNLQAEITESLSNDSKMVVDDFILSSTNFLKLIKRSLNVSSNRKFINWDKLDETIDNEIIILSYRNQGNFNNHFYPNINETTVSENTKIKAYFPSFFFENIHRWSIYNLSKDYLKALDHPIRHRQFNWDKLKEQIELLKPEKTVTISWDSESVYTGSDSRITYRLIFDKNGHSTCNPSDLHIYCEDNNKHKRIQPIRWIYENLDQGDSKLRVQKLDELIEKFNPVETFTDTVQQENDLGIIRNQFDLGDESAGRLWKILLARKAEITGVENLYNELKTIFSRNNLNIVSQGHFESTWINPESSSLVPRGNKAFKVICNYLGLPTTYLRIIYTIKNSNIQGRRNATRIYSRLLKDLFNHGCFDEGANSVQILISKLDYYKSNHNLDELGIDEDNPLTDLNTLVELIKPELAYRQTTNIEKREE